MRLILSVRWSKVWGFMKDTITKNKLSNFLNQSSRKSQKFRWNVFRKKLFCIRKKLCDSWKYKLPLYAQSYYIKSFFLHCLNHIPHKRVIKFLMWAKKLSICNTINNGLQKQMCNLLKKYKNPPSCYWGRIN